MGKTLRGLQVQGVRGSSRNGKAAALFTQKGLELKWVKSIVMSTVPQKRAIGIYPKQPWAEMGKG